MGKNDGLTLGIHINLYGPMVLVVIYRIPYYCRPTFLLPSGSYIWLWPKSSPSPYLSQSIIWTIQEDKKKGLMELYSSRMWRGAPVSTLSIFQASLCGPKVCHNKVLWSLFPLPVATNVFQLYITLYFFSKIKGFTPTSWRSKPYLSSTYILTLRTWWLSPSWRSFPLKNLALEIYSSRRPVTR